MEKIRKKKINSMKHGNLVEQCLFLICDYHDVIKIN